MATERDESVGALLENESGEVTVSLPSGETLSPPDVDEFLRWRSAKFVTIVGDRASGKTTLICAIYDRFTKGPFAGYLFAGSRTLVALEKRSHYARVESGRPHPETPRTSLSEGLRFFHFAVARTNDTDVRIDVMLSDRAGEVYARARGDSTVVGELIEVGKADTLVLLLDGGRVAESSERSGAMQSVRQTLRAYLDGGALGSSSVVQVVTTKIDILARDPGEAEIRRVLLAFQDRLRSDFAARLARFTFSEVAARDPNGQFAPAHGVDVLFADWVGGPPRTVARAELATPLLGEFDRLLVRTRIRALP